MTKNSEKMLAGGVASREITQDSVDVVKSLATALDVYCAPYIAYDEAHDAPYSVVLPIVDSTVCFIVNPDGGVTLHGRLRDCTPASWSYATAEEALAIYHARLPCWE